MDGLLHSEGLSTKSVVKAAPSSRVSGLPKLAGDHVRDTRTAKSIGSSLLGRLSVKSTGAESTSVRSNTT